MSNGLLNFLVLAACLAIALSTAAHADSFTIDEWSLGASAYGTPPDLAGVSITTVTNPLIANHQVALPSDPRTTAAAQYLMSWIATSGSFRIDAQEVVFGHLLDTVRTNASGSISITPSVGLSLSLQSSFAYHLHGQMQARLSLDVFDRNGPGMLFGETKIYDTVMGPPYSGTLQTSAMIVLPAGYTWVMHYAMQIYAWDGSTGLTGTGTGSVSFEISPEPATLALLAPLPLALLCRRARPRVGQPRRAVSA